MPPALGFPFRTKARNTNVDQSKLSSSKRGVWDRRLEDRHQTNADRAPRHADRSINNEHNNSD